MKFSKYENKGTNEDVGLSGKVDYRLYDASGDLKMERLNVGNTVVNTGKAEVALLIIGAGDAFTNIAIGTGSTEAFAVGDTELVTETSRDTATTSSETTDVTGDTSQFVNTFAFTATGTINESAVLNADSTGDMLCAQFISDINVESGDSLEVTWKLDVD